MHHIIHLPKKYLLVPSYPKLSGDVLALSYFFLCYSFYSIINSIMMRSMVPQTLWRAQAMRAAAGNARCGLALRRACVGPGAAQRSNAEQSAGTKK